ncbi:hypothetical protein O9993_06630 [Vibrio lentus]|nr:hypothetical protein [Vibrio lentus]
MELITCLVILGLVSATAMVKFLDVQGNARASKIRRGRQRFIAGIDAIYAKSAIAGVEVNVTTWKKLKSKPTTCVMVIQSLMSIR